MAEAYEPDNTEPLHPVDSSCIASVTYHNSDRTLEVRFRTGTIYHYDGVPMRTFLSMLDADSKGKFLARHVKGYYPYTRVS